MIDDKADAKESIKLRPTSALNNEAFDSHAPELGKKVGTEGKIVPQGIRSRWQNTDAAARSQASAVARTKPADDLKSAKKRWRVIIALSCLAVVLAFFAAAKDVIVLVGAQSLVQAGDTSLPIQIHRLYFGSDPNRAGILIGWGNTLSDKDPAKAMEFYNEAVRISPNFASCYLNRGNDFGYLGQEKEELDDYNKAVSLNPRYALAYHNRALFYASKKMFSRAIADYDKAIENNGKFDNPDRNFFWFNRGYAYLETKQYRKAISDFTTAISKGYSDKSAYENREYCEQELRNAQI